MRLASGRMLLGAALFGWAFLIFAVAVAPRNYGLLNDTVPADLIQAARFRVAWAIWHSAHVVQVVTALVAAANLILRRNRDFWFSVVPFVVSFAFVCLGVVVGTYPNVGFPFGYFGELNRLHSEIGRCNRVVRVDVAGMHRDLTLEDFRFEIETPTEKFQIEFSSPVAAEKVSLLMKRIGCE